MKIICIGRNYAEHVSELGNKPTKEPVVFMKPDSAILRPSQAFFIPEWSQDIHYELEVVVKLNRLGKNIEAKFAHKYYSEITVGIDFTARDVQSELKSKGLPWEKSKAFDNSCVMGKFVDASNYDLSNLNFSMKKNGEVVQNGNTKNMLHSIDNLIEHCSSYFTLKIGDILFTGTPEGVGSVSIGDVLEGFIEDTRLFKVKVK